MASQNSRVPHIQSFNANYIFVSWKTTSGALFVKNVMPSSSHKHQTESKVAPHYPPQNEMARKGIPPTTNKFHNPVAFHSQRPLRTLPQYRILGDREQCSLEDLPCWFRRAVIRCSYTEEGTRWDISILSCRTFICFFVIRFGYYFKIYQFRCSNIFIFIWSYHL